MQPSVGGHLAPGWWLLIAIIAVGCALVALATNARRYRRNAYRRQGIAALSEIRDRNGKMTGIQVPALLAGECPAQSGGPAGPYPQRDVPPAVTGESWQAFLNDSGMADGEFQLPPLQAQYQAIPVTTDSVGSSTHQCALDQQRTRSSHD